MSSAPGGEGQNEAAGLRKLVDLASRELQKRAVAQNLLADSSGVREQARALRQSAGDAPAGPSREELDRFSFLWSAPEPERTVHELPAQTRQDLQLAEVERAMAIHGSAERYLNGLLGAQLSTVEQIRHRQSVLQAILAHAPLEEVARRAAERVILAGPLTTMDNRAALYRVVNHLSELELYVTTSEALADALAAAGDAGPVWGEFAALLDRIRDTPAHKQLLSFLPAVLADVRGLASVTIGGEPGRAATAGRSDAAVDQPGAVQGIEADVHGAGHGRRGRPGHRRPPQPAASRARQAAGAGSCSTTWRRCWTARPGSSPATCAAFTKLPTGFITRASEELILFASAAKLAHALQQRQLPVCHPRVADTDRRVLSIDGCYNAALALAGGEDVVSSEVDLGRGGAGSPS